MNCMIISNDGDILYVNEGNAVAYFGNFAKYLGDGEYVFWESWGCLRNRIILEVKE